MDYFSKYLKYKNKYIVLKNKLQKGGSTSGDNNHGSNNSNNIFIGRGDNSSGRGRGDNSSGRGRSDNSSGRGRGDNSSGRGRGDYSSGRGRGDYSSSGRGSGDNSSSGRGNSSQQIFKCNVCNETFNRWGAFDYHKKNAHVYKCNNNCGFETTDGRKLYLHTQECNKSRKQLMSFKHPMHATPELVAQTFNTTYNPYLTIKIDGIFYNDMSTQFFNTLPAHWRSIEGELYRPSPDVPPLLFIFKITVPTLHKAGEVCTPESLADTSSKELSISDMMKELNYCARIHLPDINNTIEIPVIPVGESFNIDEVSRIFAEHIIHIFMRNLEQVFRYRDTVDTGSDYPWEGQEKINKHVTNCKWVPKLYIDLMPYIQQPNLSHIDKWNLYVKTLDIVLQLITTRSSRRFIKHDGLVITPNPPNKCCLVKIKPKEEMTIDLKYDGKGQFSASDGKDASLFIDKLIKPEIVLRDGSIYRCYPNEQSLFIPREEREEGKSANGYDHCHRIQTLHKRYFNLSELIDIYKIPPWYTIDESITIPNLSHLYAYSQLIYKAYINHMVEKYKNDNKLSVLDIGCGSAGQYVREFSEWTGGYIGIDIDISKLAEGKQKFEKLKGKYSYVHFIPININIPWDKNSQDSFFNNQGLWKKFYGEEYDNYLNTSLVAVSEAAGGGSAVAGGSGSVGKIFKIVLSIFSSHYSNNDKTTWEQYVREINSRTETGSELFIIFLDSDKIEDKQHNTKYSLETITNARSQFTIKHLTDNISRGTLTINPSPQGGIHTEPILRTSHIRESFMNNFTIQDIPEKVQEIIERLKRERDADTTNTFWNNYIDCISFIYLIKK